MNNEETFYQAMRRQGVTRRSFLKYCSLAATSLGLGAGMAPKIAWALENKPRIPVVWIHGLECTCCTESFIRATQSDAGNAYRQSHHRQTHYQSTWLPADPGCDERHHYLHGDL